MSSCGYTNALCRKDGENATLRRKKLPDQVAKLTCGPHVVVCVWGHLQLLFAACGPLKTSSEPRRGRGIVFRSAGRRACEPAAKPAMAIPGVILLRNGFVWPERTPSRKERG
jgi:hypothetical protein